MKLKESGIPWVGKIPEHWGVRKIKHSVKKIIGGGTPDTSIPSYWATDRNNSYLWVSIEDITKSSFIRDTKKYITRSGLESSSAKVVPPFSILYSIYASLGKIAYSDLPTTTNQAILAIQPQENLFYKFLFYFLHSTTRDIITLSSMTTQNNISLFVVQNLKIPLPPLEEQKKIADFLDTKTRQIEEFIDKKQKLITLLEEKKQTLINQCVTQGLDPSTPLKDSGVEWLGKIPTHWEVKKLKLLFGIGSGLGITKADFVPSGIPCVSYGEIHSKYPCRLDTKIHPLPYVSEDYLSSKPQALLKKGDFVFADTSEDIEGSGNFTSLQSDESVFAGYHTITLKPKTQKIHSPYFSFLFDSLGVRNQIRKEVCGVKVYSVTKSILKEVQCLIPPLEEQKAIAEYLDTQITKIDLAISKIKSQINLIKEYKTTLISEAVCGRVGIGEKV